MRYYNINWITALSREKLNLKYILHTTSQDIYDNIYDASLNNTN